MKGGDVLALGLLRALAAPERRATFAEAALLLVQDEEWRVGTFGHVERFAGFDICLCFEAGQLTSDGGDAVIVKRKAAGTLRVVAHGRSSHSGSAPDQGRNALLGLAAAAQAVSAMHDPARRAPDGGADDPALGRRVQRRPRQRSSSSATCAPTTPRPSTRSSTPCPASVGGVTLEPSLLRLWPGMDAREPAAPAAGGRGERLGQRASPGWIVAARATRATSPARSR